MNAEDQEGDLLRAKQDKIAAIIGYAFMKSSRKEAGAVRTSR